MNIVLHDSTGSLCIAAILMLNPSYARISIELAGESNIKVICFNIHSTYISLVSYYKVSKSKIKHYPLIYIRSSTRF